MPENQSASVALLPKAVGGKAQEEEEVRGPLIADRKTTVTTTKNKEEDEDQKQTGMFFDLMEKAEHTVRLSITRNQEWMARGFLEMNVRVANTKCQLQAIDKPQVFHHTVFNNNGNVPIAVRLYASGSGRLKTQTSIFCLEPGARHDFSVTIASRSPHPDRSERLVLRVIPVNSDTLKFPNWRAHAHFFYRLAYKPVEYVIRYHKVPLWTTMVDELSRFKLSEETVINNSNTMLSDLAIDADYKDSVGFMMLNQALTNSEENERNIQCWKKSTWKYLCGHEENEKVKNEAEKKKK